MSIHAIQRTASGRLTMALVAAFACVTASAQQIPMSSLYHQNRFMVNPANAGYEEGLVGHLNFRNQWAGIKGSPTTGWVSLHTPLGKNSNIGTNVVYDKAGAIGTLNAQLAYAHNIRLIGDHYLSLGVSAGVQSLQFDFSDVIVEDYSDFLIANGTASYTTAALDAGLRYHWKGLEVGGSVANAIGRMEPFRTGESNFNFTNNRHYRFMAGYEMMVKNIFIAPSALVRWMPEGPISYDATLKAGWKRIVWAAFTWRADTGPIAGVGVRVADKFSFAYAYDFALNRVDNSPWSNEIQVSFHLDGFKKRIKKLETRLDSLEQNGLGNQDAINARMDSLHAVLMAKIDSLGTDLSNLREDDLDRIQQEIDRLSREIEELDKRMLDSASVNKLLQRVTPTRNPDGSTSMTSTDLESGYYVVIESFRIMENAWKGVDIWEKKGRKAIIVYDTERKWYYVYSQRYDNIKDARKEMMRTRKADVHDAWVHKYRIE